MRIFFHEFKGGLIAGAIIVGAVYLILFFSFYDIYVFSRLKIKEANIWATQIRREGDLRAYAVFFDKESIAQKKLLEKQNAAVSLVTQSRGNSVKQYADAIGQYHKNYGKALEAYKAQVSLARIEAESIRKQAKAKSNGIMRRAKEEYSVISLFLCRGKEKIKGYYYDPKAGKLAPITGKSVSEVRDAR